MHLMTLCPRIYSQAVGIDFNRKNYYLWRQTLKKTLLELRSYRSDLSGKHLATCHMHEGILTRANVRGVRWFWYIFHEYNSFLLLPEEHIPQPPSVKWCILKSFEVYGKENVVEWFYSLPFKVYPFRIENY